METALALALIAPRSLGGLALATLEMNVEIPVSPLARRLTRNKTFYFDLFAKYARLDIKYDGHDHDIPEQRALDNERDNALRVMAAWTLGTSEL